MTATAEKLAKQVMSREVVTVNAADPIHDAIQLMVQNRVSAVPVVDARERCVGMLSTTDLIDLTKDLDDELCRVAEADLITRTWVVSRISEGVGHERVEDVMTDDVATVHAEDSVQLVARDMLRNRVHRLPVVDDDHRVIGIISTMDLLGVFAAEA